MNDKTTIEASVEGVPPRGDLIDSLYRFLDDESQAKIVSLDDPIDGTKALAAVVRGNEGSKIVPLPSTLFDDYREAPRFRRGTATMTSLDSFIAHANRFKDTESALFACDDRTAPSLTAVLDYHPGNGATNPRFGKHRTLFRFPLSDEYEAWNASNNDFMDLGEFAEFLEDRIADVAMPGELPLDQAAQTYIDRIGGKDRVATPTDLTILSKGLKINENAAIADHRNLASGEVEISFTTEHTDASGAPLTIPTSFIIGIPIFRNDGYYAIAARLRYRARPLQFKYELYRLDRVFDHAFDMAASKAADETGLPLFRGAPEA